MPAPRVVIVIPTYDEADNITELLTRVRGASPEADVLFVDDQSPDGTAERIREHTARDPRVFLMSGEEKQGLGAAYRAGFAWALDRGYDVVVQMDADLSHPPERISALVAALDDADIAVGSRYVPQGSVQNWARSRRLISRLGNLYVRLVLAVPVHDTTAGFKAFRAEALHAIDVLNSTSNGYCFQIENTWKAHRAGLRIAEVPITFVDRTRGSSKMSGAIAAEALAEVLAWRWAELTRPRADAPVAQERPTSRNDHAAA
ncbi:polyprenol monophosphomannose synthase [Nocardioides psychrotolerans]|uniref:polyprenol monophosphomannose synthase n=1 Tax=Nocardioides psychrotolerans TaxID=1005945 RepID=UPI003137AB3C